MDGQERAAAARAVGAGIVEVSDSVEGVSSVIRRRVRGGLSILGPAAAPMAGVDRTHSTVHTLIRALTPVIAEVAAQSLEALTPPESTSMKSDPALAGKVSGIAAAFGDKLPKELVWSMSWRIPDGHRAGPDVAVFLPGLGGHSGQWSERYLSTATSSGFTPVLIDYNTGLSIVDNAIAFDHLMTELVRSWASSLRRIVIVAHSMGGLITTAAIEGSTESHGSEQTSDDPQWTAVVTDVLTLGTPHEGAPLERVSDLALRTIALSETAAPIANLGHHRSQGIKDLAEGWLGSLPESIRHHAIVGHLGPSSRSPLARLLGDGLVPQQSAAGRSSAGVSVAITTIGDTHHNKLMDHDQVRITLGEVLNQETALHSAPASLQG